MQPDNTVFLKSALELGKRNMIHILGFDSKSIMSILHKKHQAHFKPEYPLIYKTISAKDDTFIKHENLFPLSNSQSRETIKENEAVMLKMAGYKTLFNDKCQVTSALNVALENN